MWADEFVDEGWVGADRQNANTTVAVRFVPKQASVGTIGRRELPVVGEAKRRKLDEDWTVPEPIIGVPVDLEEMSLPRLVTHFEEDGYTEFMLVFKRPKTTKGPG